MLSVDIRTEIVTCPSSILEILDVVSQQNRVWSDSTDVQVGLALYWWQRLTTFGSSRINVKINMTRYLINVISLIGRDSNFTFNLNLLS